MFGSQVLDVFIGIVFVYLILSIMCTAANEMIASLFAMRARNLAKGISNLLADNRIKGLDELFYDHPLIKSLYRGKRKPSYIPDHTFSLAFLDGIGPFEGKGERAISGIRAAVSALKDDSALKRLLSIFLQQAGDDFTKLQANIETWFNDAMSRVEGWYKRKSQVITIILAVLLTGATNADTLLIANRLYTDPSLRAAVVAQAQELAEQQPGIASRQPGKNPEASSLPFPADTGSGPTLEQPLPTTPPGPKGTITETLGNLQQSGILLGWQALPQRDEWPNKFVGLLLTVFAVSLGAPFWFDLLSRVIKIRSTGSVPGRVAKG
jgi:hypothetical protein